MAGDPYGGVIHMWGWGLTDQPRHALSQVEMDIYGRAVAGIWVSLGIGVSPGFGLVAETVTGICNAQRVRDG